MPAKREDTPEPWPTLIAWRNHRGLTLEQVGNILGVGHQAVHKWEVGKVPLTIQRLRQLAEIYGTTPDALFFKPSEQERAARLRRADSAMERMTEDQSERWLTLGEDITTAK